MAIMGRQTRMEWRGNLVRRVVHRAGDESVERAGEALLSDANEHVPYEFGDLEASGKVNKVQGRDALGRFAANEAFISYDTPYAVRLHEHPEYNFQGKGEGKWLEHAMQRSSGTLETDMAPPLIAAFRTP